jgi:hypothetical protein
MVKCAKDQVRRLKTAPRWKIPQEQRRRIQMVLPRESVMTQPLIAAAMGVSPSTVNRAHMTYDDGGIKALKPKPSGGRKRENMTQAEEKALVHALCQGRRNRRNVEHPRISRRPTTRPSCTKPATARSIMFWPGTAGASRCRVRFTPSATSRLGTLLKKRLSTCLEESQMGRRQARPPVADHVRR